LWKSGIDQNTMTSFIGSNLFLFFLLGAKIFKRILAINMQKVRRKKINVGHKIHIWVKILGK
jgi:hypothetical protein